MFALLWLINGCVLTKYNYKLVKIENSNLCRMNILNQDITGYEYNTLNNVLKIDAYKENNNYVVVFTTYKKSYDWSSIFEEKRINYDYKNAIIGNKISQVINNNEYLGFYEEYNNYGYVIGMDAVHYTINYKSNSLYKGGIELVDKTLLQNYIKSNKIVTMYKEIKPYQYISANNQIKTIKNYELIILYLPTDEVEECINGEPYKLAK